MKKLKTHKYCTASGGGALKAGLTQSLLFENLSKTCLSGQAAALAFTLAEMMVVLLIMSIVLACMAPVMTTKMKADQSIQTSPWRWAENNVDAYFSSSSNQSAMIGQNTKDDADSAKLIINNSTNLDDMILFKNGDDTLGSLRVASQQVAGINATSISLGSFPTGSGIGYSSVAIGSSVDTRNSSGTLTSHNVNIGNNTRTQGNSVAVGSSASAASMSTAIGSWVRASGEYSASLGSGYSNGPYHTESYGKYSFAAGPAAMAGSSTQSPEGAIAIGASSATGDYSIAIGTSTNLGSISDLMINGLLTKASGENSIAMGTLSQAGGAGSIAIGSGSNAKIYDIAIGYQALNANNSTSGSNTAIGYEAMQKNTTGYSNTAVGYVSLINNTTGGSNVGIGYNSLQQNTTGFGNVAVGASALSSNTSSNYNTAIGHFAGSYATGANNIMLGSFAGRRFSGSKNVAIGSYACQYVTGSNKTCIGASSGPSSGHKFATNSDNIVYIGTSNSTVYIPGELIVGKHAFIGSTYTNNENSLFYNSERGWHYVGGYSSSGDRDSWGISPDELYPLNQGYRSDRRLKYVGTENHDGLAKLRQIKVFNYTFKKDDKKTPRVGVMAQDLQKIFPNAVKKGADGFLTIRMEDMFYAVINAIKELDARVTALEKENKLLKEQNKALDARLKALEAKIK